MSAGKGADPAVTAEPGDAIPVGTRTLPARAEGADHHSRPMRADAVKNRRRILEAAEEVFAAEGLGVPIDVVAERAGVGVGTLYRHFPTKEALFEAIVVTRFQELVDAAGTAGTARDAPGSEDPGEAFLAFLRTFAGQASIKRDLFDALTVAGVDIKSRCAGLFDELQARLQQLLDRATAAGAVRSDVTTNEVIGLVVGACHAAEQKGVGGVSADRMIEVVCDGLRRRT